MLDRDVRVARRQKRREAAMESLCVELDDAEVLRAVSMRPPWSWAYVAGFCKIVNREWKPRDALDSWIAIHSGMTVDEVALREAPPAGLHQDPPLEPRIVLGAIVGVVKLTDVIPEGARADRLEPNDKIWFRGPYGWYFGQAIEFEEPLSCRGCSSVWTLDASIRDELHARLRGSPAKR